MIEIVADAFRPVVVLGGLDWFGSEESDLNVL
jgi:hypothetical protein